MIFFWLQAADFFICSGSAAVLEQALENIDELLLASDRAMYNAKECSRRVYKFAD